MLEFYGKDEYISEFEDMFDVWGWWFVFIVGLILFFYKVIIVVFGVVGFSLLIFIVVSLVFCGLWFFIVVGLLYFFGLLIKDFIEKCFGFMFILFVVFLVGGFVLLRLI